MRDLLLKCAVVGFFVTASAGKSVVAQVPTQNGPDPMNNIAVTLTSGTVVHIRNLVIFRSPSTSSALSIYIETPTPASEPDKVASEAKELADVQIKSPIAENISNVIVAVCRTQGCLEMRERPTEMFVFERQSDGSLKPVKVPDIP